MIPYLQFAFVGCHYQIFMEFEKKLIFFIGTIHIYKICRQMMVNGFSKNALDYLIWSCISMESSVPLMTKKYLPWRCQLYTAVCHCYYDLNHALEAENFARRGLNKVIAIL